MNPTAKLRLQSGLGLRRQRGVALAIALILLVVITLVGLAAIGTTILQNRATANQYDRQIAFQSAEAAMRVAMAMIANNSVTPTPRDCGQLASSDACPANPFTENPAVSVIHTVNTGAGATQFTVGANAPMQPQFVVEDLGDKWPNPEVNLDSGAATCAYEDKNKCAPAYLHYFRITARSCDPANSNCDSRAIVTLQSIVKQG